ncbi:AMP-binding protein [Spirillospora sp. NBC_00431]
MPEGSAAPPTVAGTTITEAVLDAAKANAAGGGRAALIDARRELGYGAFAREVTAAADGLRRHGARPGDVGAVHVSGVCDLALAVHAVCAAGAVPALLPPDAAPAEVAALMNESGARFMLTGEDTAPRSLAAAERSYVRQVFAFGDVPGTTPFGRLLEPGTRGGVPPAPDPLRDTALRVCTPSEDITHADRLADLYRLTGALSLGEDDALALSGADVPALTWIGLVDLCITQGATVVGMPSRGTGDLLKAVLDKGVTVAVVTPAKLRAIAFDHGRVPVPGVRLLVYGTPSAEAVRACRTRHGWTVSLLC